MPELNKSDGNVLTAADVDDIDEQMIVTCTSSTRPTGVDGRAIYETDTGKYMSYNSTAAAWAVLGGTRWVTFTPSWTNITVGNGTSTGRYRYVDGGMRVVAQLVFGTTTSVTGTASLTLPNSETSASGPSSLGFTLYTDTGTADVSGRSAVSASSTTILLFQFDGGVINSTNPFTWVTSDILNVDITVRL